MGKLTKNYGKSPVLMGKSQSISSQAPLPSPSQLRGGQLGFLRGWR